MPDHEHSRADENPRGWTIAPAAIAFAISAVFALVAIWGLAASIEILFSGGISIGFEFTIACAGAIAYGAYASGRNWLRGRIVRAVAWGIIPMALIALLIAYLSTLSQLNLQTNGFLPARQNPMLPGVAQDRPQSPSPSNPSGVQMNGFRNSPPRFANNAFCLASTSGNPMAPPLTLAGSGYLHSTAGGTDFARIH